LQQLIPLGAAVNLRIQTRDRYGRTVAEVFRDGRSVNLAMVSSGEAFAYRRYLAACDGSAYLTAEAQAQHQKRGFWSVPGGIEKPWDWRHGTKSTTSAGSNPASGRLGSSSGSPTTSKVVCPV
jgi:endonuclease YncB( thermonuclease family)